MSNPLRGEVAVEIAGQSYTLLYNVDALATVERATGKSIGAIALALDAPEKVEFTMLRDLLWAGLRAKQPEVTVAMIGKLMPFELIAAMPKITEAIEVAFPKPDGGQGADNPPATGAGTGPNSAPPMSRSEATRADSGRSRRGR